MAVLALRLCGHVNAVSQLHAKVSRRLWLGLLPELADEDIRIQAITNGVHRVTWTDPEIAKLPLVEGPELVDREALWRRPREAQGAAASKPRGSASSRRPGSGRRRTRRSRKPRGCSTPTR